MLSKNDSYYFADPIEIRIAHRVRKKSESFVTDGIVSSYDVVEEFENFGDETTNFRDFSLRSIISAQAVDLLKPIGMLPYDMLRAADKLGEFTGSFGDFAEKFDIIKKSVSSHTTVAPTATSETK